MQAEYLAYESDSLIRIQFNFFLQICPESKFILTLKIKQ